MRGLLILVLLTVAITSVICGHSTAEWKSRTIYQVLTDRFSKSYTYTQPCPNLSNYCGGTFKGIQNNLDYIQNMGFDAIWVSPIITNTPNGYHGYWAQDIFSINPNFGSEQDFIDLVNACHARNIWMMVDVVGNHVGPVGFDYSTINPFNQPEHYHDYCQIQDSDFSNDQWRVENCRLADLPDLKQENSFVRSTLISWIQNLVQKYNIDGLRIDTIPEVPKDFWGEFTNAAGVYAVGEVFDGRVDYVADYQNYVPGLLNYPMYFTIKDVFAYSQSMYNIRNRYTQEAVFKDIDALGTFVDNHDNPRFLYYNADWRKFKSALTFALFSRGIPIVYYGSEQGYAGGNDPNNREQLWTNMNPSTGLYTFLQTIIKTRKQFQVWGQQMIERWCDDTFYAFSRGQVLVALTNQVTDQVRQLTYTPYTEGQKVCNIFYSTDCVTVTNGKLQVYLVAGEVKIFVPS